METAKCRILFVEDHEDTRELLALALKQSDYEVVTSASIAGALALVPAGSFDLFVLDSLLPDGTGIELCKRIREIDQSTPILFYSALAYERDRDEAFSSGAQRYLIKPVSIPLLCQTVAEMVRPGCESDKEFRERKLTSECEGRPMTCAESESKGTQFVSPTAIGKHAGPTLKSPIIRRRPTDRIATRRSAA